MNKKMSLVLLLLLSLTISSFGQLSVGLKAYYSFKGNPSDLSGNGNDGSIIGSPVLTQDRFGIADCAYYFPGTSNDYISINYSTDFDIDSLESFSISLWYQGGSTNEGDYEILFEKPNPTVLPYPSDFSLALYDLNKPGLGSNYLPIVGAIFDPPIPDSNWHHVVGIYDNKNWYFFEDNTLVQSDTSKEYIIFQSMNNLVIGKNFEGVIDDIRFYDRALNFFDVYEIYHLNSSCIPIPPQPICQPLISTLPYNSDTLKVPARFYNKGSYDFETPPELLRFSYSTNPDDSIRIYTCGSPVNNFLEVYVFDAEGAYDYCTNVLFLGHHYCDTVSTSLTDTLSPIIFTADNKIIPTIPDSNFLTCFKAEDFVIHGYDNSDISNQLVQYSFSENEEDSLRCFGCHDVGQYLLSIYGTDTAGNTIHVPIRITVVAYAGCDQMIDTMRPVALCKQNLILSIDSLRKTVLYPGDLDEGSYDNVTEAENLRFTFEEHFGDSLIFSCEDLGPHSLSIFVKDESNNASLCTTEVIIDDPNNLCNISSYGSDNSTGLFSIYPNPGYGFYIKYGTKSMHEKIVLNVFSMLGEPTFTKEISNLDEYIIPAIPPGMYTIFIQAENTTKYQFKWVKM